MAERFLGLERLKHLLQNLKRILNMTGSTIQNITLENPTATGTVTGFGGAGEVEGTQILSTGEAGAAKFLREDGDGTCSWQTVAAGVSFDGDTGNGILTYKDSDEASVETNLTYDGTTFVINDDTMIKDDHKLYFGNGSDASIEYDENGTDELRFAGAAATFEQDVTFDNDVVLGVAAGDVATVTGRLTASRGLLVPDDMKLRFGASSGDGWIEYDEDDTNKLIISGSASGLALSGSLIQMGARNAGARVEVTGNLQVSGDTLLNSKIAVTNDISASGDIYGSNLYISASGQNVIQVSNTGNTLSKWEWHRNGTRKWVIYNDGRTSPSIYTDALVFKHGTAADADATHINMALSPNNQDVKFYGNITASGDIVLDDDQKLRFGSATGGDATIEYDEDGTDELRFAGAATTFEQDVTFDNNVTLGVAAGDVSTVTGQLTASRGMIVPDDMKLRFGAGSGDATIEYDENGSDQLRFAGAATIFEQDITGSKGANIPDDVKLRFGNATGGDAHIRYAETGNDHLIISGSSTGIVLSGSQLVISGDKSAHWHRHTVQVSGAMNVQYLTGSKGMMIPDDQKLRFGSAVGGDVTLKYDESNTDTLLIEGGNVAVADDKKLYFGTGKDSFVEYNEDGDDFLIISGSAKGIALSGTLVNINGSVRGRMLHYTYHNYNYTSTAKHYIPINSTIETTDIETEYNHWLAPHNGKLVKIIVNADGDHAGDGTPPGSTEIGLHLDRNGTAATTVTENLTIASAGVGDNVTFTFASSNTFTAGQFIAISVDAAARLYDMRMTCVWEYDTTT